MEKKMSLDVAADIGSVDSLSFAGLVCIQEHSSKPLSSRILPPPHSKIDRIQEEDPEFKFGHVPRGSASTIEVSFSHGQPLPEEVLFQSDQSQVFGPIGTKDLMPATQGSSRRTSVNETGQSLACRDCHTVEPTSSMKEH